ncbi:MAG: penicillin-binding transpeptidase domain-containing protein [Bacillota bacterium]|nr:penicillin-binding transpeptidase domain-containing protein [Bacillota bacterium]MDW7683543.1 penicillin-binding transpeptidase domain-containing protein [Bacillota bacterium]
MYMFKRYCVFLLFVFLLLVTGCAAENTMTPEDTVSQYIEFWSAKNFAAMYPLLSVEAKKGITPEAFTERFKTISDGIGLNSVVLREVTVDEAQTEDDTTVVRYTLDFFTGTVPQFSKDYTASLQKDESGWLVDWEQGLIFPGLTEEKTIKVLRRKPQRGRITDRNSAVIAAQGTIREIGVVPGKIEHEPLLLSGLEQLLEMSSEAIRQKYTQSWVRPDMFVPIKKITESFWQENAEHFLALKGVMINRTEDRVYDMPRSLAQTVGYVSEIGPEKLEMMKPLGYRAGDQIGTMGIESVFEGELAGTIGFTIVMAEDGQEAEPVAEIQAVDGGDLRLTLDKRLQDVLDGALGRHSGSAVILNVQNGELLAVASKPGFDSNLFSLGITPIQYSKLQSLDSPFINRTFSGLLPPGSAFKPFTALMGLSEEVFNPDEPWDTPIQWQKDAAWGGYRVTRVERPSGPVDLSRAMKYSDNVYFADLSLKVGWDKFISYAERLGFSKDLPLAMPTKSSQLLKSSQREPLLADSGFGQGELQVTPLHMTLMYAAIARGDGSIPAGRIIDEGEPAVWQETGFSPDHIALIDDTLLASVSDPDAVGFVEVSSAYGMRGKTGTAEITAERQIGWFVCYFDDYVLVVALEGDATMTSKQAIKVAMMILEHGF